MEGLDQLQRWFLDAVTHPTMVADAGNTVLPSRQQSAEERLAVYQNAYPARLLEVLQMEIARADRHNRQFAVVFFDMDGLKRINDEMGHLIGSRAVCRLAETLRSACRETDTPARYGGDEFVAVLSDTDHEGAKLVVKRTNDRLHTDTDQPRLAVSSGIAVYPRDGGTPTTLLSAADRALYANKAEKANARRRGVVDLREWTSAG